jgi:hypothetical protein
MGMDLRLAVTILVFSTVMLVSEAWISDDSSRWRGIIFPEKCAIETCVLPNMKSLTFVMKVIDGNTECPDELIMDQIIRPIEDVCSAQAESLVSSLHAISKIIIENEL